MCRKNRKSIHDLLLYWEIVRVLWDEIFGRVGLAWVMSKDGRPLFKLERYIWQLTN